MQIVDIAILNARKRHGGRWISVVVISAFVSTLAGALAYSSGHAGFELFFAAAALFALMTTYAAFLFTSFAHDLWLLGHSRWLNKFLPLMFTTTVYLTFSLGTGTFAWHSFVAITCFVLLPSLFSPPGRKNQNILWQDWVTVALIWLPFDFGLLKNVWLWPLGTGAYILNTAVAVCLAIYLFSSNRRIAGIGFRLQWRRGDLRVVLGYFSAFCAIAIPFGFFTDFVQFNIRPDVVKGLLAPIGIFLFIAYPEELLFRGLLQNFISQRFGSEKVALIAASLFFGATHLNNGPFPDWRYFVLATVAGVFYGAAYSRTKNLLVPAVIHALVDAVWMQFLMKGP